MRPLHDNGLGIEGNGVTDWDGWDARRSVKIFVERSGDCCFFFSSRRRHTRFDCDWSSDVCSSDLDGGIRFSGDIAKAIAAGAHAVMIGGLFAGTEESPGEVELYQGASYKSYRGMGSLGALGERHGSADRYFQDAASELEKLVPEGVEGRVPYKGSVVTILRQLAGGLRAAMGYTGSRNITDMRTRPRVARLTAAGIRESHVHDVSITKEAPNYRVS